MITFSDVSRTYQTGRGLRYAVRNVSLHIEPGSWVTLVGPSGSGKSTLLNLIAGLDRPSTGSANVGGIEIGTMTEEALARWRARHVGIVFQFFQLLPTLTARENVILPMEFAGRRRDRDVEAMRLLQTVGVAHLAGQLPSELSGGEQQRVAVARALANDPPLLVADEPTGNLDAASGSAVLDLLVSYWQRGGTLILVTHDPTIASMAPRVLSMKDGVLIDDTSALSGELAQVS